jgi:hypothetical protein
MYKECASKPLARAAFRIDLDESSAVLSFHNFGDQLSGQGLGYSLVQRCYPGDSAMRAVTRLSVNQQKQLYKKNEGARKPGHPKKDEAKNDVHVVMPSQLKMAKSFKVKSRLCGDLTAINHHIKKRKQIKHHQVCSFCGEPESQAHEGTWPCYISARMAFGLRWPHHWFELFNLGAQVLSVCYQNSPVCHI